MVLEKQGDSILGWAQCWLKKHFRRVWNEWLLVGGLALGADRRAPPGACVVKRIYILEANGELIQVNLWVTLN